MKEESQRKATAKQLRDIRFQCKKLGLEFAEEWTELTVDQADDLLVELQLARVTV